MPQYEAVIGLEVHAELLTESKIFCTASAHFGGDPNTHVGPVSLGLPGTLPVLNKKVVEMAIKAGLATDCKIPKRSKFDRKHYFYPDLPKGYQITQYDQPIAENGKIVISTEDGEKTIRLNRIHMEEDAGKLVHAGADRMAGSTHSFVDYNRAGVPLLEIVSEPDIRSSQEARLYLESLRQILMAIEVCDGKMQEGSMRCDANVSIRPVGQAEFGTRVEIKNINSFKFLQKAIDYEISRQKKALKNNQPLVQETRLWDENNQKTLSMRSKEEANDYRYFPDPDLVFLDIDPQWVQTIESSLPELPGAKVKRYEEELGLSREDAQQLIQNPAFVAFFEDAVAHNQHTAADISKWLLGDISAYLNDQKSELEDTRLTVEHFLALLTLVNEKTINRNGAKKVLPHLMETDTSPQELIEQLGLTQISDQGALQEMIQQVLKDNPAQVQQYLDGKTKVMGFFVGQIMKQTQGRADPGETNRLLKSELSNMG